MQIKDILAMIPNQPGSYQMYNESGTIIYVGKAKNLHKRVSSYFNRTHTGKTAKMVSEIRDIKYIITNSEVEALILEINLIKQYMPKYNILLTDDKSYPYIEYVKKPFPKLKVSRYLSIKKKDKKLLFGPYPNAYAARKIVNLINRLYPLKKCDGNPKNVCLYYHLNECLGYCTKKIDSERLERMENDILSFLRGNDTQVVELIKEKIAIQSANLNFELAKELNDDLDYLEILRNKQKVELTDLVDRDIFGFYYLNGFLSIQTLFLRNGKLIGSENKMFSVTDNYLEEIECFIGKFYLRNEIPKEVLVSSELNVDLLSQVVNTKFLAPERGTKRSLLKMAEENAQHQLEKDFEVLKRNDNLSFIANEELKVLLQLPKLNRIEIFDNSNLFGDYTVSGMVVYINGIPSKKDYRKFKISLQKNDDYNTMKEVIYRRYFRLLVEKKELPDLIIVDGGANQINAALEVLESLKVDIPVYGLKKNDKHSTNNLVNRYDEIIEIDKYSNLFKYLTNIQDEVHRFTITFHRDIRSKGSLGSVLSNVEGIGIKRQKTLLKRFGSLKNIEQASIEELKEILPDTIANNLQEYLRNRKN